MCSQTDCKSTGYFATKSFFVTEFGQKKGSLSQIFGALAETLTALYGT
jgi:hypothetical protein